MSVEELAELANKVCGLSTNWGKACIYYCMASHKLQHIDWMPALQLLAPPGSGKSQLMKVLARLAYRAYLITCYDKMTSVTLRNMLAKARDRTAIIEEADLYPNRTELERYLINRASPATSVLPITRQKADSRGAVQWVTTKLRIPGATIVHDRRGLDDLAAERRAITVHIRKRTGETFLKPDAAQLKRLCLPSFSYGTMPDMFDAPETMGSGRDTWEPLIRIANSLQDDDWLGWVWDQVAEFNDRIADGQQFELELTAFKAVIRCFMDNAGMLLTKAPQPLKDITAIVKDDFAWVKPKTVATVLRKMGFRDFRNIGGKTKLITTTEQLKKIAADMGYKDDLLT